MRVIISLAAAAGLGASAAAQQPSVPSPLAPPQPAPSVTSEGVIPPALPPIVGDPLQEPSPAPVTPTPRTGTYGIIIAIDIDKDGKTTGWQVQRSLAMTAERVGETRFPLPEVWVSGVRRKLDATRFPNGPQRKYVFFVFDPTRPDRVDIGPDPTQQ